jgi:hypothetical protein
LIYLLDERPLFIENLVILAVRIMSGLMTVTTQGCPRASANVSQGLILGCARTPGWRHDVAWTFGGPSQMKVDP